MRIRQYSYFALKSRYVSAAEVTARLGLEPDEITIRGSRQANPARPVCHMWKIVCREPGLTVDKQLTRIVARLQPYRDQLRSVIDELTAGDAKYGAAVLEVVRYFNDEQGEEEELSPSDAPLQKIPGQHQLLGWGLEREVLKFLLATNAYLDVDEYG